MKTYTPLVVPNLDDRTAADFVEIIKRTVYENSQQKLNDFAPGSWLMSVIEGEAAGLEELAFKLNQTPTVAAIGVLRVAGIEQSIGSFAKVKLTFSVIPSGGNNEIPQGFEVSAGTVDFRTDRLVVVPPNVSQVEVEATAVQIGLVGNVGKETIRTIKQPLAFIVSVTNLAAAEGGNPPETLEEVFDRGFKYIRRKGLISLDDFEDKAREILGKGSAAYAFPAISADRQSKEPGSVHVFCLNANGSPLNSAQISQITSSLYNDSTWAVIYVSSLGVLPIKANVIANIGTNISPQSIADSIFARLAEYLRPGKLEAGQTLLIKELEYQVRQVTGVESVGNVSIYDASGVALSTNLPLPNQYTVATLQSLKVTLVLGAQPPFTYNYQGGQP